MPSYMPSLALLASSRPSRAQSAVTRPVLLYCGLAILIIVATLLGAKSPRALIQYLRYDILLRNFKHTTDPPITKHAASPAQIIDVQLGNGTPEALYSVLFAGLATSHPALHQALNRLVSDLSTPSPLLAPVASEVLQLLRPTPLEEPDLLASLTRLHVLLQQQHHAAHLIASVPGLRRAVVAIIVWQRLRYDRSAWSTAVQGLVADICSDLVALHNSAAQSKVAVEFLHISKSGGTSMCSAAQLNGCTSESLQTRGMWGNCKVRAFNDLPRWVSGVEHNLTGSLPSGEYPWWLRHGQSRQPEEDDCVTRSHLMRASNYTFYSNEYATHTQAGSPHVCSDFLNVVLLRNPEDRLQSQIRSIIFRYRRFRDGGKPGSTWVHNRTAAGWRRLAPAVVDNLYVRSLLGQPAYELPAGSLTQEHADTARWLLLERFDVLLVLEEEAASSLMLRQGLGWYQSTLPHRNGQRVVKKAVLDMMPMDFPNLLAGNVLDFRVYEWGLLLQRLDAFVFATTAARAAPPGAVMQEYAKLGGGHQGNESQIESPGNLLLSAVAACTHAAAVNIGTGEGAGIGCGLVRRSGEW